MEYLIGLDIGTTAVKAILIDSNGKIMVKSNIPYGLLTPKPHWVEQDPEEMWQAVHRALAQVVETFEGDRHQIRGLSLSTQRDTMVCVDDHNRPLRNAITWMDSRSQAECDALCQDIGARKVYDITGVNVSTIWTFAFILWLRNHEPQTFASVSCFGLVHDFILCRLGAKEHVLDVSNACQTMLYDYRSNCWSSELMEYGGLSEEKLPHLVPSGANVGYLSPALCLEWGLRDDFQLISGGGDQQCAAMGAGAVEEGNVEIGIGTAANLLCITTKPVADDQMRMICHRSVLPDGFVLEGAMLAMGRLVEWMKAELFPYASLREIDEWIETDSVPGANGLSVLPHFEGAACPYWDSSAVGMVHGLRLSSTKADIARAVLESTAFEIKKCFDLLREFGSEPTSVRVSGGASRSAVWMQILADVLQTEIQVPANTDCAALGAAILAGIGCGVFVDASTAAKQLVHISQTYLPRETLRQVYEAAYQKNKTLYRTVSVGV